MFRIRTVALFGRYLPSLITSSNGSRERSRGKFSAGLVSSLEGVSACSGWEGCLAGAVGSNWVSPVFERVSVSGPMGSSAGDWGRAADSGQTGSCISFSDITMASFSKVLEGKTCVSCILTSALCLESGKDINGSSSSRIWHDGFGVDPYCFLRIKASILIHSSSVK